MRKNIITLTLLAMLLLFFGCSRKASPQFNAEYANADAKIASLSYETEASFARTRDISENPSNAISADLTNNNMEHKLVKRANIRIRVENLETADTVISDLTRKYGAYAASTEIEENFRRYSLRVPSQQYDAFLGEMDGMGRIFHRSETTEDVTVHYYDLEGRLATKRELLKTYQLYLGRAKNIEEILSVEARIAELQNEIDWPGTQLRNLSNLVDYATIELNLLGPAVSMPRQGTTFGEQIKMLFGGFGEFISKLIVIITGIVIYGIPILLFLIFFYFVLFGRIGLLKKLWRIITSQKQSNNLE